MKDKTPIIVFFVGFVGTLVYVYFSSINRSEVTKAYEDLPRPYVGAQYSSLLNDVNSLDWKVQVRTIRTLGLMDRELEEQFELLSKLTKSKRWNIRLAAIEALAEIGCRSGVSESLLLLNQDLLHDKSIHVRWAALESLGEFGLESKIAQSAIQSILDDSNEKEWPMKQTARWALGQIILQEGESIDPMSRERPFKELPVIIESDKNLLLVRMGNISDEKYKHNKDLIQRVLSKEFRYLFGEGVEEMPLTFFFHDGSQDFQKLAPSLGASPYSQGSYNASSRIQFINANNSGTTTHELTHALMHADNEFYGRWGQDGVGIPAWVNEGIAGIFEGCISVQQNNDDGKTKELTWDLRYRLLVAALQTKGKIQGQKISWELESLPDEIPPLSLAWLIGLSNHEFTEHYKRTGNLSICLAREFFLYLWTHDRLKLFYYQYKEQMAAYKTRRYRAFFSSKIARTVLEDVCAKSFEEIEQDFLEWVLDSRVAVAGNREFHEKYIYRDLSP